MKNMTVGKPMKLIIAFMIPTLIGSFIQQLNVSINAMIVGQYVGVNELAAIGSSQGLNFLFMSLIIGLSIATSVCISQYFGANDQEKLKQGISTGLILIGGASLLMMIFGVGFAEPLLQMLRTPPEILPHAGTFLTLLFIGLLPIGIFNGYAGMLRAFGNAIAPLGFQIFGAVLNVVLSLLFIIVLDGGLVGSALANVLSQFIMLAGIVMYAYLKVPYLKLKLTQFIAYKEPLKMMLKMGIPSSIQMSVMSLGNMAVQIIVNGFGMEVVAGVTAAMAICMLAYQPAIAVGSAASIFVGQNIGAKKFERVNTGFWAAVKLITILSLVMTLGVQLFRQDLLLLFLDGNDVKVLNIAESYLIVVASTYVLFGFQFVIREIIRGTGNAMMPMMIGFAEVGFRLAVAFVLSLLIGYAGIWIAIPIGWIIATLLAWLNYRKRGWESGLDKPMTFQSKSE